MFGAAVPFLRGVGNNRSIPYVPREDANGALTFLLSFYFVINK
jgi:hypothetical protein